MISLHHTHLMSTDVDATIAFWCNGFNAEVVHDVVFAGARNVFLRIGTGRIHLYDQPPIGQATVHHLGVQTDELDAEIFQPDPSAIPRQLWEYFGVHAKQ
jgi:catechol 2,3-dioxygenase-like lactoylglutathione lyase family enzyme